MNPSVVLEWFEVVEWFAVDDRLRRAIIARDALRHAGGSGHGAETDERPGVNLGNPDSGASPGRAAGRPPTHPALISVPAFRLPGRGVF